MEFEVEILQCRICMLETLELVFLQSEIEDSSKATLLDTFNFCTQLQASEDDDLPQYICTECNQDLLKTFDFIKKAQKADQMLRMKENIKIEDLAEYMIIGDDDNQSEEDEYSYEVTTNDEETTDFKEELDISIISDIENYVDHASEEIIAPDKNAKFCCTQCSSLFETEEILAAHLKESHFDNNHLCYICGKTCTSRKVLNSHISVHKRAKGEKRFSCQFCSKKYARKSNLISHLASIHSEGELPTFVCSICGRHLSTKQNLRFHLLDHTGEKNHECEVCGKKFASSDRLKKHMRSHTGEKPCVCKICGVKFENFDSLRSHDHGPSGSPVNVSEVKRYTCEFCPKKYAMQRSLDVHLASVHSVGELPTFSCSICGKEFRTKQGLQLHHIDHSGVRKYECDVCGKKFPTSTRLLMHSRIHTDEKRFVCNICGVKYKSYTALRSHKICHTGEKPYECNVCGERFSKYIVRRTHMLSHTEKIFECLKCNEKFSREIFLKRHEREKHTEDRPYACHKCPNTYKLRSDLRRHLDRHLGIRYKCYICSKAYCEASALKMHMFSHSEEKRHQCPDCTMQFARMSTLHLLRAHNKVLPKKQRQKTTKVNVQEFVYEEYSEDTKLE